MATIEKFDGDIRIPDIALGPTWNGWQRPKFTPTQARCLIVSLEAMVLGERKKAAEKRS